MTQDEAIKRILWAIAELASQSPIDRTSANDAITMLEEVVEPFRIVNTKFLKNPIHPGVPFNRAHP